MPPRNVIKSVEERTVLLLKENGEIYNDKGELIKTLPDCESVTQIIVDGDDYFVSGMSTKDRVGYWKNGKWNTLHIDFIDDVEHWAFGIGKWDYYIFLLNYPYVLKNSGIFRLNDCKRFAPAHHGIAVSEGECYVVGYEIKESQVRKTSPILYTEHKGVYEKEELPFANGTDTGEAIAIYAYDKNHFIAGGFSGREPVIWIDRQVHRLPRTSNCVGNEGDTFPYALVLSIVRCNGHIYCGGYEYIDEFGDINVPVLWCDDVPQQMVIGADRDDYFSGRVVEVIAYGNDVYTLTQELYDNPSNYGAPYARSILWLNGKMVKVFDNMLAISFAVF